MVWIELDEVPRVFEKFKMIYGIEYKLPLAFI